MEATEQKTIVHLSTIKMGGDQELSHSELQPKMEIKHLWHQFNLKATLSDVMAEYNESSLLKATTYQSIDHLNTIEMRGGQEIDSQ